MLYSNIEVMSHEPNRSPASAAASLLLVSARTRCIGAAMLAAALWAAAAWALR
jgi:hypothetical protein